MTRADDGAERSEVRSVARRYRRRGYRVTAPEKGAILPTFLEGLEPDLIAESDEDRVVIEVKRNDALRGSNDLRVVAERVAQEPGWRFELVAIQAPQPISPVARERMDQIAGRARQAMNLGLPDLAYMYAWSVVEVLLVDLAQQNGLKPTKTPIMQLTRDLVSQGVISAPVFAAVEQAGMVRNRVVHIQSDPPSASEVERLLSLGEQLRSKVAEAA